MDHPIFRSPNAVSPTLEDAPTPKSYAHHPAGRGLGDRMPMWRVQTEGYSDGEGMLIGIVSNDAGFLDSPATEWISGGVNTKGPRAVALGRHGNFFHWGFAASPTYMTDEAKLVFVNAIHHIAGFDGQTPVARKQDEVFAREMLAMMIDMVGDEGYADLVARYEGSKDDFEARQAEIRERIDAGEEVSDGDRRMLDMPAVTPPGRYDNVARVMPSVDLDALGDDPDVVVAKLTAMLPYVASSDEWYQLEVDADLQALGIANHDPRMLEAAIGMLGDEGDRATGQRLLARYTGESFAEAEQWRAWLDANRDDLFFSDVAGYRWLVNRRGPAVPASGAEIGSDTDPIASEIEVEPLNRMQKMLKVEFQVRDGWHAYHEPPKDTPYVGVSAQVKLPDGVTWIGRWSDPETEPDPDDPRLRRVRGTFLLETLLDLEPGAAGVATLTIRYQLCDATRCLPPTEVEREVTVRASGKRR